MTFQDLFNDAIHAARDLTDSALSGSEKLAKVTGDVDAALEQVDDLVSFLPPGFAAVAKAVVDNPTVDSLEKSLVAKNIAEAAYQAYKWLGGQDAASPLPPATRN